MRRRFLNIFIFSIVILFIFPLSAKANYGDLNYRISRISISDSTVTLKGWAFIHRTNNYSGTDHTILLQAYNRTTGRIIETKTVSGRSGHDFYCELYLKGGEGPNSCTSTSLKHTYHTCTNNSSGVGMGSKCYYENIDFTISFDVMNWTDVNEEDNIVFRIAATNSDFRDKLSYTSSASGTYSYGGLTYTGIENVYIPSSAVGGTLENDYIKLDSSTTSSKAEYIAAYAYLIPPNSSYTRGMAAFEQGGGVVGCDDNVYDLRGADSTYYSIGVKISSSQQSYDFNGVTGIDWFYCPGSSYTFKGYASHMKVTGNSAFVIHAKVAKKCEPVTPNNGHLYCNNSTVFNSDCEELTVRNEASRVSANVSISQTGTISNVLTPDSVHAGGGFNFGIIYTNSIKWSYVRGTQSSVIVNEMNNKIKDYSAYIAGLNITGIEFGGRIFNTTLRKECSTSASSSTDKNYLDNELIVTCVFYIPESILEGDGNVRYIANSRGLGISNKYYTPMSYDGTYRIRANIEGMNRIKDSYAREDSKDDSVPWTGTWVDTFENCEIDVYPLFYADGGKYNFIYRPIDIYNPFPNRNPGINWFDWYSIQTNRNRLESSYSRLQYSVNIDNNTLSSIKRYNERQNSSGGYFDWQTMSDGRSSFINDYFSVKRENIIGDSS